MKDLATMEQAEAYNRNMAGKYERMANRQQKCIQCLMAKTYSECPDNCIYLDA